MLRKKTQKMHKKCADSQMADKLKLRKVYLNQYLSAEIKYRQIYTKN